jgi:hypothetical protein
MALRLEVQARNSGLEVNLRGRLDRARVRVQQMTRRRGANHYRQVYDRTPKRTWFMANHLRYEPSPDDFTYRLGWAREDFEEAGKYPYYRVVLFGSRTQVGHDYFSPIAEEQAREYRAEFRQIMRSTLNGRAQ